METQVQNNLFTEQEARVLQLIGDGHTNVQIAGKIFKSVRTVETIRAHLLSKTKTTNTATLIKYATLNGYIR